APAEHRNLGKASMSFRTALSLSLNNLLTKKGRTILTAFAGSIGIIGIALILSLSSGMQAYINNIQEDTLSTYPIQITRQAVDLAGMMSVMMGNNTVDRSGRDPDQVYSNNIVTDLMTSVSAQMSSNDLARFKTYLDSPAGAAIREQANTVQYAYDLDLQIYAADTSDGVLKVNPSDVFATITGVDNSAMQDDSMVGGSQQAGLMGGSSNNPMAAIRADVWTEMIDNTSLLQKQYEVLTGRWPENHDEVVVVVDDNNELSDVALYSLGLLDQDDLKAMTDALMTGKTVDQPAVTSYTYDDLLDLEYKLVLNPDVYEQDGDTWTDQSGSQLFMKPVVEAGLPLDVVGVIRPGENAQAAAISGTVAYLPSLREWVVERIAEAPIVVEQEAKPTINVLTGLPFDMDDYTQNLTMDEVRAYVATLSQAQQAQMNAAFQTMSEQEVLAAFADQMRDSADAATLEDNLAAFGVVDVAKPSVISIFPKDFEAKDAITAEIERYNADQKAAGHEEYGISYSDVMAIMMSSVTSIMDIITYVLIAFVAISLVVSSIMIGIITYISVLERTKEIGILRSIGASKRDVSRVFNAETVIEGLAAGVFGIGITLLLNIPINLIIKHLVDVSGISALPPLAAVALIGLSVLLTVIAGLFPSRLAAKRDPVEALRTE
ncbi:MAG: ABC transporter permease, partial [Propionibacteriaceae bacterium]|nr:ABC transporter permease [Propionibacteriaceae bacterium]